MFVNVDAVHDSADFPEQVDVVVISGGILDTCAAHELAGRGVSVALLEKGLIGCEQSSRNWGWVRQQNRALYELPLAMHSQSRWDALSRDRPGHAGARRLRAPELRGARAGSCRWAREWRVDRAGGLIRTSSAICASGAWSSRFCRRHGVELPSANIMGPTIQTTPAPEVTPGCLTTPKIALRRRLDGYIKQAQQELASAEQSLRQGAEQATD